MIKKVSLFSAITIRVIAILGILVGVFILLPVLVYVFYTIVKNIDHHGMIIFSNNIRFSTLLLLIIGEILLAVGVFGFFWSEETIKKITK
jgi:hypothetical protein